MKKYYIAAFMPEAEGGYSIVIPDVPQCYTCADDLDDAMLMAQDVLALMLQVLAKDKKTIPQPSSLAIVKEKMLKHMLEIDVPLPDDTLYQLIPAPSLDLVPVKIMVSIPKATLEELDQKAKELGYTRSGFLAMAAKAYQPNA